MSLRDRYNAFIERHEVAWELSFAMLALAFVATGFVEGVPWLLYVDATITAVFVGEFTTRLAAAYDRRAYLRGHWIDVFALIPAFRGFRLLRLLRLGTASASSARPATRSPCASWTPRPSMATWPSSLTSARMCDDLTRYGPVSRAAN